MATSIPRQLALAEQHFRKGNHDFAEPLLREILSRTPAHTKANELLGYITGNRGELDVSFALLKTAVASPEASGEASYYLGKHFLDRQLFSDACVAFEQALSRAGNFFEGLHDLAVAMTGSGNAAAALAFYDKALALRPDFAQGWFNKAVALDALNRFDDALHSYNKALAIDPSDATAWYNRGATLNDLGRYDEALASHDKTLALDPAHAKAWSNRGVTLSALKRYKEALACHEKALSLQPGFAEAWGRGADVFSELKYPDKALTYFAKALALKADIPYAQGGLLRARMALCLWTATPGVGPATLAIGQHFEQLLTAIDAQQRVATPFVALAMPSTLAQQRLCGEIYSRDRSPVVAPYGRAQFLKTDGRIRIGYFSCDFRTHAVSFLTAGLFEHHDRSRFEVHAFALSVPDDDPVTARLRAAFEHFHNVENLPDHEVVEQARRLNIDIAIDLTGHTQGARTGIFARRAAPVQVSYLGFPGTMGAPFIDYLVADSIVVPDGNADAYTEKVVFLPDCFQINDAARAVAPAPCRASCGIPDEAFVFCSFNSVYKINPRIFDVWMNIMQGVQHSVLWLVGETDAQQKNLRAWAATRGVAPHRLIFAGTLPYAGHLARYALADLVLDTLPFNGGTTTSDALWGGAPVLTCTGNTFAGRMAASLLHTMGLPELVTGSLDDYQTQAVHLAHHPAKLEALRQRLSANRATSPLFNTRLGTRHIEAAYVEMHQRAAAGLPPAHLRIAHLTETAAADTAGNRPRHSMG